MEEKIEWILWNGGEQYEGNADLHMNPMTVKMAAAEIAKLVEDKEAELATNRKALANTLNFLRQAEAQLAEMRGVLDWLFNWIDDISYSLPLIAKDRLEALDKIEKALSAAPEEVLWAGEAVYTRFGSIRTLAISNMETIDLEDGQGGRVILIKERDDEKPKP